jgi:hypothetical protein
MPSPFPGMDPYLEGRLWSDVHHELASVIRELLVSQISPTYVARIAPYTVVDTEPGEDVGIFYPDVEVLHRRSDLQEPREAYASGSGRYITPPTLSIPATSPIEVRIPTVEIHDRENDRLITAIEILSPVNKRRPGLEPYRKKRSQLHAAGIQLLEIDLLRRGRRPFVHPQVPPAHYLVTLMRAGENRTDVWAIQMKDSLPVLPVPLRAPDPDAMLDLGQALATAYERGQYQLSIDYRQKPPPPKFSEEEWAWMRGMVQG